MNIRLIARYLPIVLGKKRSWLAFGVLLLVGSQFGGAFGIPAIGFGGLDIDQLWKEPRDVLVDRVEDAREAQQDTVTQFRSAMEEFKSVTDFDGGDLESVFNRLNSSYEKSESAAENIENRVDKVVSATNRMLDEWKNELNDYHDASIRAKAESQFDFTRQNAEQMINAMRNAAEKTAPVLNAFRDQVLFLKHNLNMQAITTLDAQTAEIQQDVSTLIQEMENSIAEATAFIEQMGVI